MICSLPAFIFLFFFVFSPAPVHAAGKEAVTLASVITEDTTVSGEVILAEDLLIPEGVTLTMLSGTTVRVLPSDGSRTDAQFLTSETEIMVHGELSIPVGPVSFRPQGPGGRGSWGGIALSSPTARARLIRTTIVGAETAIGALDGKLIAARSTFSGNEIGIAAGPKASTTLQANRYLNNGIGILSLAGGPPLSRHPRDRFEDNDVDTHSPVPSSDNAGEPLFLTTLPATVKDPPSTREYVGEVALGEDTVWTGTVVVDGQVAVPEGITLTVDAGTRVLFRFRDTNGDGLGESWLIVQGRIKVKGREDAWVLFDAEDEDASPGSWDSLSIIASESGDNTVQYALFRRGVKAFHSHFSRVSLSHVVFEDNLRGVQFQESEGTSLSWGTFRNNRSAMRFRDSVVELRDLVVEDNLSGINFLRSTVSAEDLFLRGNLIESLLARESETSLTRALFTGNRRGPRFRGEGESVDLTQILVRSSLTEGLSLNRVNARIKQSDLSANGFTGLSVTDADVVVRSTRLASNGLFAVDNNGSTDVDARGNDWGTGVQPLPETIYDGGDEEGLGMVLSDGPVSFNLVYPGMSMPEGDIQGSLIIVGDVTSPAGRTLKVLPGTHVGFAPTPQDSLFDLCSDHPSFPSSELMVAGRIVAEGTGEEPITFASTQPTRPLVATGEDVPDITRARWGSINLTGGKGGTFRNCIISEAATGVHVREADRFEMQGCLLSDNQVGLRFSRSNVSLRNNIFRNNVTGLRFHEFGGSVRDNRFEHNLSAIFVTDNPKDVTLRDNIFQDSVDYHIKLGIHTTDDVTVEGGTWEVPTGKETGDLIFDQEDDPELGRVIFKQETE